MSTSQNEVTQLLQAWSEGDLDARDRLFAAVYPELERLAAAYLRREQGGAFQPAALVHEAYLRLVDQRSPWLNRSHFFGMAAQMMRRILVDRGRARRMSKRSGRWSRVTLGDDAAVTVPADVDLIDLDAALTRLAAIDARKSRVAELRFFAGLTPDEIAAVLGVSRKTVEREWQAARAWLLKSLSDSP